MLYQLAALDGIARVEGDRVRYVKPHGVLYNTAVSDEAQASVVVSAVVSYGLPVLGLLTACLGRSSATTRRVDLPCAVRRSLDG